MEVVLDSQHYETSSDNEDSDEPESENNILIDDDVLFLSDDEIPVEQFAASDFDDDLETEYPNANINFADSWILVWIFKFQARFRLSDVAIDSLIKFFHQLLKD